MEKKMETTIMGYVETTIAKAKLLSLSLRV